MTDEELAAIEATMPPPPRVERDSEPIWFDSFGADLSKLDCDFDDDYCEKHPPRWHIQPVRVRREWHLLVFEIMRQRPDGKPGEDWSPMTQAERYRVLGLWLAEHIVCLSVHPHIQNHWED